MTTRSVLITGGLGFLGRQVARAVLRQHAAAPAGGRLVVKLVDNKEESDAAPSTLPCGTSGALLREDDAALARAVLEDALGPGHGGGHGGASVEVVRGDISDAAFCARAVGPAGEAGEEGEEAGEVDAVFHLAAVMSGQAESDLDSALGVNLRGTLNLLEALRNGRKKNGSDGGGGGGARQRRHPPTKFVFASSGAVFGKAGAAPQQAAQAAQAAQPAAQPAQPAQPAQAAAQAAAQAIQAAPSAPSAPVCTDATKQLPESSYGMTKACCELLVNDYTRRGFIVGRSARLPTVVVRPGAPNAATTGVFSSVVREPLAGADCASPLPLDLPHAVVSHRTAVDSLLRLHDIDEGEFMRLAPFAGVDRAVNLHATSVTLGELHREAERVASLSSLSSSSSSANAEAPTFGAVHLKVDDALAAIVGSMPSNIESDTAAALGLPGRGHTARDLVRIYCEDFAPHMNVATIAGADAGGGTASEKEGTPRRVVAFLGLGNMGESMARNVVSSGNFDEVRVWNRTHETAQSFAVGVEDVHGHSATTVTVCDSPREAAEGAQVSMLCLETEQACEQVLLDPDHGVLTAAGIETTSSVIVDHSTVSPDLSQRCHIKAAGAGGGVMFLDGPVSGGPEGASAGTLSIMCGGEEDAFHLARPVLECMGDQGAFFSAGAAGREEGRRF
jgi:nucleoside-diphosphate-sugar epimerase